MLAIAASFSCACARVASSIHLSASRLRVHRRLDLVHHLLRALLALGAERLLHERAPERLAHEAVDRLGAALPARLELRRARQRLAVEREVLVDERLRQRRRRLVHEVPPQVRLPLRHRRRRQHLVQRREEVGRRHVDRRDLGNAHLLQVRLPIPLRRRLLDARQIDAVIDLVRIAAIDARHRRLRQRRLDLHDRGRVLGRLRGRNAGQRQHLLDVRLVGLAQLRHLAGRRQVVVAVGHADAALVERADDLARVLDVLVLRELEHRIADRQVDARHLLLQARQVADDVDALHLLLELRRRARLDARLVHAAGVQGADLVAVLRLHLPLGRRLEDLVHLLLVVLVDHREAAPPRRLVGRDLRALEPAAAGVLVEVVTRADARIHGGLVETGLDGGSRRGRRRRGGHGSGRFGGFFVTAGDEYESKKQATHGATSVGKLVAAR